MTQAKATLNGAAIINGANVNGPTIMLTLPATLNGATITYTKAGTAIVGEDGAIVDFVSTATRPAPFMMPTMPPMPPMFMPTFITGTITATIISGVESETEVFNVNVPDAMYNGPITVNP
ncbi:hypothetical protein [Metabacillus fastidiosus]|uniref:hypothetical protein n=1 Tax=Metabacillus fastidiosus TaxID=1458 RepID=UPI002E1D99F9|nr:hypothetical protein [Metabacillus fastidiosus]